MQIVMKIDTADLRSKLAQLGRIAKGEEPQCRAMMREIGLVAMADVQRDFDARSRGQAAQGVSWRPISPITALFRRRGRWGKMENAGHLRQRALWMPIMRDTGKLFASISPLGPGSVFTVQPLSVTVGTNDRRAERLHAGGSSTFAFTGDKQKRFDANVRKVLPGHKPDFTPKGNVSHAKKNWNRWYFVMRNWLRKISGTSFTVPARPIITRPSPQRAETYATIAGKWIDRIIGGRGTA